MNRGSAPIIVPSAEHELGFNEAPIHESGKCQVEGIVVELLRGFNEAPIHESGKSDR